MSKSRIKINIIRNEDVIPSCTTQDYSSHQISGEKNIIAVSSNRNKRGSSILIDLNRYNFPSDIKEKADEIYQKMDLNTHRNTKRKRLLFLCVLYAYQAKEIHCDPKKIIQELELKDADMTKAISAFSEAKTGYSSDNQRKYPIDCLPDFCRDVGIESVDPVITLAKKIILKDKGLLDLYPQTVAAGILSYYMQINGIIIESKQFMKIVGLSDATINNMKNKIAIIDNLPIN